MFSNIRDWIDLLSGSATILSCVFSILAYRRAGIKSRTVDRKVRLRIGKIEWVSIRKEGDHSL